MPTVELVSIDFTNGTVVVLEVECAGILVVVEFVHAVERLSDGGVPIGKDLLLRMVELSSPSK